MEKKEKLKAIAKMAEEFGISPDEVVAYFQKKELMRLWKNHMLMDLALKPIGPLPSITTIARGA